MKIKCFHVNKVFKTILSMEQMLTSESCCRHQSASPEIIITDLWVREKMQSKELRDFREKLDLEMDSAMWRSGRFCQ